MNGTEFHTTPAAYPVFLVFAFFFCVEVIASLQRFGQAQCDEEKVTSFFQ